ncbi:MAG: restriction endonuclease subunit S [Clostridia bacterium]|nr:restriction endonuclease subunit S [Clostridia bacterium]
MEVKKLKDCCTIIAGQSPESKYYNTNGDGLPFFQGKADFGELYPSIRVYCSQPTKIAEKDDILLSVRAPVGPTNLAPCKVCIGRGLTAIRPSEALLTRYVLLFFRYFEAQLASKGTGTTFKAITQDVVKNLEIPIPPILEQERIVARIEELFSQLDAGVTTLKKTKAQLAVYRQAVLKEAFGTIAERVLLGDISESRLGKMLDKEKNTGVPRKYLRNINVRWFRFDLTDLLEMRIEDDEIEKYSICKGDLVICEGGEPGRCAVWQRDDALFYQKALHRVRFTDCSNPLFYMYYLWYAAQTGQLKPYYTGTGIKHLTGQSLVKVPVPTAGKEIQNNTVAEIESRLSVCDSIEQTVDTALQQAEAMRQSILKKSFEGRL